MATAAGVATVTHIVKSKLLEHVNELASYLDLQLEELKEEFPVIKEIRGKGLLKGLVVEGNASAIVQKAVGNQLLILTAGPNVVRILPPLTASKEEINEFKAAMEKTFQSI